MYIEEQVHFSERKQNKEGRELLTITVDIGEGQQENILIRDNDDPF